ncbi:glycosyltransferase family 2 protein [Solitalea sp. MAHUQ-68]|uniref:Glycosyltransferase family 2 protein n=1 Tax=Solitalea agri TaxID=2953739 RepID=A0A9X2F2X9_9SPHI|nr:glycosyltransferase family 2 protein [Solitalea agri]MCO4293241.1 glycosyltransferase family 2 protein [Solitalea agri]
MSKPVLSKYARNYNEFVSILIPARNEGDNILNVLSSIKNQDYKNYEVLIYDDNSTDNTAALAETFAKNDSRFKVFKGEEPPKGWLGKNYACHRLGLEAKGEFLLFIDADVILHDRLIDNALHRIKVFKLSLISLFVNQKMHTLGERLVVPLMNYVLLTLLPLRLISLSKWAVFSAASGQFMFFDAKNYRKSLWHEQVRRVPVSEVEIMKLLKQSGYRGEALLANGFADARAYTSYPQGISGLSNKLLAGFNYSVISLLIFLFLVFFGYSILLLIPKYELLGVVIFLIVGMRYMVSLLSNQNVLLNFILHPLQIITLVIISILSIHKYLTKTLIWKGRNILR